jgi:glycosyltransferase involved in cell wall biosynthesis
MRYSFDMLLLAYHREKTMKLIVTIPAYNEEKNLADVIAEIPREIERVDVVEVLVLNDGSRDRTVEVARKAGADHVVSHKTNLGLARTFSDALWLALSYGADIVVNTDGDNHYDQSKIPLLIRPILESRADIAIGSRVIHQLEGMPAVNKYGNMVGTFFVQKLFGLKDIDVSTGFRAYSRDAAMRMLILSRHTYTHETLIQAQDLQLVMANVPIAARKVNRKSRLIKSIPSHIAKSVVVILRSFTLYKPLRAFSAVGALLFVPGALLIARFLYFYFTGGGQGHIQSLIIASILMMMGFQVFVLGVIASAIGWNRKINEEVLYRIKKNDLADSRDRQ